MPVGTVNSNFVNNKIFLTKAKRVRNQSAGSPHRPNGLFFFDTGAITIATTQMDDAGDQVFALTFPGQCRLIALQVKSSDRDTHATPTLVEDIIAENAAGTEIVLINDTTIGQGGLSDELDLGLNLFGVDVSAMKLGSRVVTAAATVAAGTLTYKGLVLIGALAGDFSSVQF